MGTGSGLREEDKHPGGTLVSQRGIRGAVFVEVCQSDSPQVASTGRQLWQQLKTFIATEQYPQVRRNQIKVGGDANQRLRIPFLGLREFGLRDLVRGETVELFDG